MAARFPTRCDLCKEEINPRSPSTFEQVIGWVSVDGSKNFRTEAHMRIFAHKTCLDLKKKGRINQEAMF